MTAVRGRYSPDAPSFMGLDLYSPDAPRPAARTASPDGRFRPQYGVATLTGDAATIDIGAHRVGLPAGARIGIPADGHNRVLLVLDGDVLHALTPAGEILNLPPAAASALGDEVFGRPDVRPPP